MGNANEKISYTLTPFIILTFIYFIVGFLTTINGQFQGPMQIAFLDHADKFRNTFTTLISFFFFLGYLLNSSVASGWVNSKGYKITLLRALAVMIGGLLLYSLSAWVGSRFPNAILQIDTDLVPWAYFIFLAGCFLMGTSAAMLQVVINPYIAAYQLPNTTAVQRMNISTGCNSIGTTIGPFFVTGVIFAGASLADVKPGQLIIPILGIAIVVGCVYVFTAKCHLPDLASTRSSEKLPRSVWSFSHLALGVCAIFLYVGAEVSIGVNINLHALQMLEKGEHLTFLGSDNVVLWGLNLGIPALLATFYWGGMMVGRLLCSAFPSLPPGKLLCGVSLGAAFLALLAMITDNLYILSAVGLCHSVMWSCVFTLAIAGLGLYTSRASGIFMMGVFGGAIFPLLQGALADVLGSWRWTWFLVLLCELALFYYAVWGSRVKDPEALANLAIPPDPAE